MRGSYGLVLVLFSMIVELAETKDPVFVPVDWLPAVHVAFAFGLSWVAVAVLVRAARRVLTQRRRSQIQPTPPE